MLSHFIQTPYLTPKAELRETDTGFGIFSVEIIARLELVAIFGGKIISAKELALLTPEEKCMTMQVGDDEFSFSEKRHVTDYINHSCDPNIGFDSHGSVRSMQDIDPDTEIGFDYAMADSTQFDEFSCLCGSSLCRGEVTGDDWQIPELQTRYKGWFIPYLQLKINRLTVNDPFQATE